MTQHPEGELDLGPHVPDHVNLDIYPDVHIIDFQNLKISSTRQSSHRCLENVLTLQGFRRKTIAF